MPETGDASGHGQTMKTASRYFRPGLASLSRRARVRVASGK